MDIQKEREAFEKQGNIRIFVKQCLFDEQLNEYSSKSLHDYTLGFINGAWWAWQAKAQAVPAQLDVNSILHDIDCYFDNGLSNTERTANNLLQSIYEKLSGEVKAQEPAND